jgi:hypothetical protein
MSTKSLETTRSNKIITYILRIYCRPILQHSELTTGQYFYSIVYRFDMKISKIIY